MDFDAKSEGLPPRRRRPKRDVTRGSGGFERILTTAAKVVAETRSFRI